MKTYRAVFCVFVTCIICIGCEFTREESVSQRRIPQNVSAADREFYGFQSEASELRRQIQEHLKIYEATGGTGDPLDIGDQSVASQKGLFLAEKLEDLCLQTKNNTNMIRAVSGSSSTVDSHLEFARKAKRKFSR